jgi:ribosomal protein S18 acetylase RimI-like enzyme
VFELNQLNETNYLRSKNMRSSTKENKPVVNIMCLKAAIPAVLKIEADSFASPLKREDLTRQLARRNVAGFLALEGTTVVGYLVVEIHQEHFELTRLAVRRGYRRRGVGCQLLRFMAAQLPPTKRKRLLAVVPDVNLGAHLFLRSCRYRATAVLRPADKRDEDSYQFEFRSP